MIDMRAQKVLTFIPPRSEGAKLVHIVLEDDQDDLDHE